MRYMTINCPYCVYCKNKPLPEFILTILSDPDLPSEDYILWMSRMMKQVGFNSYASVKVHIGRMHKGVPNDPNFDFAQSEVAIMNRMLV